MRLPLSTVVWWSLQWSQLVTIETDSSLVRIHHAAPSSATKGRFRPNKRRRGRSLRQAQQFNRKLQLVPDDGAAIGVFLGLVTA
jgi:hypothetical protein